MDVTNKTKSRIRCPQKIIWIRCPNCLEWKFVNVNGHNARIADSYHNMSDQECLFECLACGWRFHLRMEWSLTRTWEEA